MPAVGVDDVDPRVLRTRRVVLEAVVAELAEAGHGGFSVESVASRAGVGKATVYRHWKGKAALIAEALETLNVQPEAGTVASPRGRVEQLLTHLAEVMADSPFAACVPGLIEAAERDVTIRQRFHRYSALRRQPLRDAIADGLADGAFAHHVDPDLAAQALAGAIMYRRLMTDTPLAPRDVPLLMTSVLGAADGS